MRPEHDHTCVSRWDAVFLAAMAFIAGLATQLYWGWLS